MSTATIAQLVVELSANAARFTEGMNAAQRVTAQTTQMIENSAKAARRALEGMVAGLTVGAGVAMVKGAIDAADALNDLSQKTGVAVEKLGGLEYAAKASGTNLEGVATGIRKMSINMADAAGGSEEAAQLFKALGVSVTGAGGELKSADAVLLALADRFAAFEDGPEKAALAVKAFGKTGADMIPLLNMGGDALREMLAEYDKYGGIASDTAARADQFNDTLEKMHLMSGALARTVAASLLPTLQAIADVLVDAKSKGGGFAAVGDGIAVVLKSVAAAGMYAFEVLRSIGTSIGAVAAIVARALAGDFSGAAEINRQANADLKANWEATAKSVERVWTASTATMVVKTEEAGRRIKAPLLDAGKGAEQFAKMLQDAEKVVRDAALAFDDYGKAADEKTTPAMRRLLDLEASPAFQVLPKVKQETIRALYEQADATQRLVMWMTEETKIAMASIAADEALAEAKARESQARVDLVNGYAEANDRLARENELIGGNELSRRLLAAAIDYENAKRRLGVDATQASIDKLDEEYERRRQLITEGFGREQAVAYQQEWERAIEGVSRGLGNFFVDLVENGSSAFKRLWNNFKRWALEALAQVAAKQVVVSVIGAVSGVAAGSASASSLNSLGSIANVAGMLGGAGTFGSSMAGGLATVFGGAGGSGFLAGMAGDAFMPAALAGGLDMAAFGAAFAAVAPWAAIAAIAIPMIIDAFDKGPAMRSGTWMSSQTTMPRGNPLFQGSSAFGSFGVVDDKWFSDSDMGEQFKAFIASIQAVDNAVASLVGKDMTARIAEQLAGVTEAFSAGIEHEAVTYGSIMLTRYTAVLNTIDDGLGSMLDGFDGTAQELAALVTGIVSTYEGLRALNLNGLDMEALKAFQVNGESIADTFSRVSTAYLTFVDSFTTDAEKLAAAQTLVTTTFEQLGMSVPDSVAAYRQLVQSLDLSTESGRKAFTELLNISGAFLAVRQAADAAGAAVEQVGKTAAELAAIERQRGGLEAQLLDLQGDAAGAVALRRKLELEQMDESLRPLQERIYALQDEQAASDAAAKAIKAASDAARAEAEAHQALVDGYMAALGDVGGLADPLAQALAVNGTPWQTLSAQAARLDMLATYFDGTAVATDTLRQATQAYGQTLVQTIGQIEQLKSSLSAMFEQTIRGYTLDGLDAQGKYGYLQEEVNRAMAELASATDPARIQALAQLINSDQQQAYGLLSPEQKAAARQQFIEGAQAANELVQARLKAAEDAAIARNDKLVADLRAVLMEAGVTEQRAADTMLAAANKMDGAEITVRVTDPKAGTVGAY